MSLAGIGLCLSDGSAWAQNATINIMPMGDSVTARGGSPESSYRFWLNTYLTNAGFSNAMFVGNTTGDNDGCNHGACGICPSGFSDFSPLSD